MATIFLRRLYDRFAPDDKAAMDFLDKLPINAVVKCVITRPRNVKFHKRAFALLNLAFEHFEPPEEKIYRGEAVEKNIDTFREHITVLAGFYTATYTLDGNVKLKAKSWSFAKMSQDEFEDMYSKIIDVILTKVMTNYTREDVDQVINEILGFC